MPRANCALVPGGQRTPRAEEVQEAGLRLPPQARPPFTLWATSIGEGHYTQLPGLHTKPLSGEPHSGLWPSARENWQRGVRGKPRVGRPCGEVARSRAQKKGQDSPGGKQLEYGPPCWETAMLGAAERAPSMQPAPSPPRPRTSAARSWAPVGWGSGSHWGRSQTHISA